MIFWRKLIIFASKSSLRLQVDAEQPWITSINLDFITTHSFHSNISIFLCNSRDEERYSCVEEIDIYL